ncbi:hypothetical protein AD006_28705 (plasmid) [Pseudonocardia sp. EC080610-09]|nr:hypothetical protein AD006_28705 [Pseudonocardia sp. EC080610-09]ALL85720.1 hypothetical protein AD017_29095 [Pseudonocardia sp. EC080619-01]
MITRAPARPVEGELDRQLWDGLVDTGFHLLDVPEEAGGSGGDLSALAAALDVLAHRGAAVPAAESALAGWLAARAGLRVPAGLALVATGAVRERGPGRLSGTVTVPWGRHADHVVVPVFGEDGPAGVAVVAAGAGRWHTALDVAGEPRDELVLADARATDRASGPDPDELERRGALVRAAQLAGAARGVLDASVRHAGVREQFGRPLAAFQAVKHHLATMAGEVGLMRSAVDSAVLAESTARTDPGVRAEATLAIAAAKAVTSAGAGVVAAAGHQVHGALGYAREHDLGRLTTRLWSWRDEFGDEGRWQDRIAARALAGTRLWHTIAGPVPTRQGEAR